MSTFTATAATEPKPGESTPSQRLMSVDALRGFDMFWIIGAGSLVYALNQMSQNPVTSFLATQLEHAEWEGFRFYDLIFPLFVFIAGVSTVFSLAKAVERAGRSAALKRVLGRALLLYVVGVFYSGGFTNPWPAIRVMGVLNRIAVAYLGASLLFCFFKPRALAGIAIALLVGYWALLTFTPIRNIQLTATNLARVAEEAGDPQTAALFKADENFSKIKDSPAWAAAQKMFYSTTNYVTGKYAPGLNLANHIDFQYLPGLKWDVFFDPEGWLSSIPAVVTCLLGIFAGLLLKDQTIPDRRKVALLIGCGVASVALGWLWSMQFPVVKKIWTSSLAYFVAGGYSAVLLGIFFLIVDVWQWRVWCQPFVWMGMNSITIYLANNIIGGFRKVAARLVGGDIKVYFDDHAAKGMGDLAISVVGLLLAFWLVRLLYRRKVFLRL